MAQPTEFRRAIAAAARQVLAGHLGLSDLIALAGGYETGDDQVDQLIHLLEHEPKADGWLGVSKPHHAAYVAQIDRVLVLLETNAG
jgi:hypothetical protein